MRGSRFILFFGGLLGSASGGTPPAPNTLVAGRGSFVLTGDAMTPLVDRKLPSALGTFALTGQDVTLTKVGSDAAETTAFLARTSGLDATHIAAYKALINGLVADGVFTKLDALWVTATQDLATARLNLVSSSYALSDTNMPPSFVADRGITAAAFSNTSTTQFTPSVAAAGGSQYQLNSAHAMLWSNTVGASSAGDMGTFNGSDYLFIFINAFGSASQMGINNTTNGSVGSTTPTGQGFYLQSRTSSTNRDTYWNNTSTGNNNSGTASGLPTSAIYLGGVQSNGNSGKQISAGSLGGALNSTDAANFYARLRTYMTTVGVP